MADRLTLKPRYLGKGNANFPDSVDIHVGARIKLRRKLLKISQTNLGNSLGISFQQLQKYESGRNRVSASRLYNLSQMLGVRVEFFFEGFDAKNPSNPYGQHKTNLKNFGWLESADGDLMERKETIELVRTYYQVKNRSARKNYVKILLSLIATQS